MSAHANEYLGIFTVARQALARLVNGDSLDANRTLALDAARTSATCLVT